MLSRRLIMDYPFSVKEALLTRYPSSSIDLSSEAKNIIESIDQIKKLGFELIRINQQIEQLKEIRHKIADSFSKSSTEEKQFLKQRNLQVKEELSILENRQEQINQLLFKFESSLPNIPEPDSPLWKDYSPTELFRVNAILTMLHSLKIEYNS